MPFDFLKRKKEPETAEAGAPAAAPPAAASGMVFDGFTEEWRLVGRMQIDGRLSDVLNKREPISIDEMQWAPIDGSTPLSEAPGLRSIDPYDLILVIAGAGSLPTMTDAERDAHRIHKVHYDLLLEAPPFKVIGTVSLHPGADPRRLLDRSSEMFVAVVDARATYQDVPIDTRGSTDLLVNRFYLRAVDQVDHSTGEKAAPLPGIVPGSGSRADWPAEDEREA